jgi:hypothetical protein
MPITDSPVIAGGHTKVVTASKTRPSDTTAYASGDVIAESTSAPTVFTFSDCVRVEGGSGVIGKVTIADSANVATKLSCELWLFSATVTPDNDNAAFTPTDTEMLTAVAVVPISTAYVGDATSGAGGNALLTSGVVNLPFKCDASSKALYGVLVARNAYAPVSAEVFTVSIYIYQD